MGFVEGGYHVWPALKTLWHEFGHAMLDLDHTCESYHIMSSGVGITCDGIVRKTKYVWSSEKDENNWQRAVKDKFEGVGQNPINCNSNRGSNKIACDLNEH